MSGHSKWSTIKHKKALTDKKRGKLFSKISKIITIAAKEKGGDPQMNPKLRMSIDTAKSANMPQDNIERAIKKGTGELEGVILEEFTYEAYGPGNTAIIIEGITDNGNRTVSEIKHLLGQCGGKMANPGNVLWMFDRVGQIVINAEKDADKAELTAIDAGAEDVKKENSNIVIFTKPENLYEVKNKLEGNKELSNIEVESAEIVWKEKNTIKIEDEKTKKDLEKLFETIDDYDDTQNIYSNADF